MRSIFTTMALAALAASEMAGANRFYPDVRDAARRRNAPDTFRYPYRMIIDVEDIDLAGKSHGNRTSKRKARRDRAAASAGRARTDA